MFFNAGDERLDNAAAGRETTIKSIVDSLDCGFAYVMTVELRKRHGNHESEQRRNGQSSICGTHFEVLSIALRVAT